MLGDIVLDLPVLRILGKGRGRKDFLGLVNHVVGVFTAKKKTHDGKICGTSIS